MPSGTRFIPITISLDGTQAAVDFKQFSDGVTSSAKQASQSIIDANKKAYDEMTLANQKAFAQFRASQLQMVETLANAFEQGLQHGPKAFFKSLFDSFKQTLIKMESEWAASKVMKFLYPTKSGSSGSEQPWSERIPGIQSSESTGRANSAAISEGLSFATSPTGKSFFKSLDAKFGFGGGAKSKGAGTQVYNEDSGDPDDVNGGDSGSNSDSESTAASGTMMGLGLLEGFTNSGGKLGAVENGLMTAGMMLGPTPIGLALMGASVGLGLQAKIFGWGKNDQRLIHDAIKSDPLYGGLDIKDNKILDQIKQIGDQQWPGKVKEHVAQLIHEDQVKELLNNFGMFDLKNNPNYANSQLALTHELGQITDTRNDFTRRAMGGPVAANMPYLVGEKRPELFIPRVDGAIHPDPIGDMTRRVLDGARSKMSLQNGNQGHSTNGLAYAIQSLVEQVSRLTAISPGQVLQTGAQQNPTAISGGLIEGLRQNFGHRRELNGITGA